MAVPRLPEPAPLWHHCACGTSGLDWASADGARPDPSSTEPEALVHERSEIETAFSVLTEHPRVDPQRYVLIARDHRKEREASQPGCEPVPGAVPA